MKSTVITKSLTHPGVSYEIHKIGPRKRAQIQLDMADVDEKLRGMYIERAVLQSRNNALIQAEVQRLGAKTAEEINQGDWSPDLIEGAKTMSSLDAQIRALTDDAVMTGWLKGGLVAITGCDLEGITVDELMEFGPEDLADEIFQSILSKKGLTPVEAENLSSLTTSGASGEAKSGTAPIASATDSSLSETATTQE